ncbi:hypothetical protein HK104_009680, partial [Borealophlyctis nickersoniae]
WKAGSAFLGLVVPGPNSPSSITRLALRDRWGPEDDTSVTSAAALECGRGLVRVPQGTSTVEDPQEELREARRALSNMEEVVFRTTQERTQLEHELALLQLAVSAVNEAEKDAQIQSLSHQLEEYEHLRGAYDRVNEYYVREVKSLRRENIQSFEVAEHLCKEAEDIKQTHAQQLESMDSMLKGRLSEIEALQKELADARQYHEIEMQKAQQEIAHHQKELLELKQQIELRETQHKLEIQQLHNQWVTDEYEQIHQHTLQLESACAAYAKETEDLRMKLRDESAKSDELAIEVGATRDRHAQELEHRQQLQHQLSEMLESESRRCESLTVELAQLRNQYERDREQLQLRLEQAAQELKKEIAKAEEMASRSENARQEHAQEKEQLQQRYSQLVEQTREETSFLRNSHAYEMEQLLEKHRQELAEETAIRHKLIEELTVAKEQHIQELENALQEHGQENEQLQQLYKQFVEQTREEMSSLRNTHAYEMEQLLEKHRQELAEETASRHKLIEELTAAQEQHIQELENARQEHGQENEQLQQLYRQFVEQTREEMSSLRNTHAYEMEQLLEKHRQELAEETASRYKLIEELTAAQEQHLQDLDDVRLHWQRQVANEIKRSDDMIAEANRQLHDAMELNKSLSQEYDQLVIQHAQEINRIRGEESNRIKYHQEMDEEMKSAYERQLEVLRAELDQKQEQFRVLDSSLREGEATIKHLRSQLQNEAELAKQQLDDLHAQIRDANATNDSLLTELTTAREAFTEKLSVLESHRASDAERASQQLAEQASILTKQLREATAKNDSLLAEMKTSQLADRYEELKRNLESARRNDQSEFAARLAEIQESHDIQARESAEREESLRAELHQQIARAEQATIAYDHAVSEHLEVVTELKGIVAAKETANATLKRQLESAEMWVGIHVERFQQADSERERLKTELRELAERELELTKQLEEMVATQTRPGKLSIEVLKASSSADAEEEYHEETPRTAVAETHALSLTSGTFETTDVIEEEQTQVDEQVQTVNISRDLYAKLKLTRWTLAMILIVVYPTAIYAHDGLLPQPRNDANLDGDRRDRGRSMAVPAGGVLVVGPSRREQRDELKSGSQVV